MRRNGSRHFELRATLQMGRRCGFQDAGIRAARHADENRMAEYSNALQPWVHHFRSLDLESLSLADAHQQMSEQAVGRLPDLAP